MTVMQQGEILSVQTGRIREMQFAEGGRENPPATWTTGIFKSAVIGPVRVTPQGMAGDQQADLDNHGGPDNVVLAYDSAHYPQWREWLRMPELAHGAFGENFTVRGFSDEDVCIGDVWEVGGAGGVGGVGGGSEPLRLQVTQARQPCFKLARRIGTPEVVRLVREKGWGGWYLRVLRPGIAEAGMAISRVERHHPDWPVARAVHVMYARRQDPRTARLLAALPELSRRWKEELLYIQ